MIKGDILKEIITSSNNWNEVLNKLKVKSLSKNILNAIKNHNISTTHLTNTFFDGVHTIFNKFTKEELETIVHKYNDWNCIMAEIGYKTCTYVVQLKEKCDKLGISYTHVIYPTVFSITRRYALDEILVENSPYCGGMRNLLRRLKKERNWEHKCSVCNLTTWNEKPIPLEIDHIDGCHSNNTYENLRAICPNCHAQTDTYKGKNMSVCKHNTRKTPPIPKEPKPKVEETLCTGCSKHIDPRYTQCNTCRAKKTFEEGLHRKVERPTYEQLLDDIRQMSMVQVGKKYGVSDNAIRKWIRTYEKYAK